MICNRLAHICVLFVFFSTQKSAAKSARRTSRKLTLFIRDFLDRRRAHNRYRGLQWMLLARRWERGLWGGMRVEMAMMVELEEVGKRELEEDVAQLVRPIHVPMKRLRRTDVVKREENYYDYYY